ncbi:MAG: hypothetical protein ACHQRK_08260 [Gemmatimonadales bacterium]
MDATSGAKLLSRARQQLAALAAAEGDYLATSPYRLVHEHEPRRERYVVRVQVLRPLPEAIASLAGDVARHLHESLDELATRLAGAPTRFPIFESLALFAQRSRKAIAPMADEAQATLEALQPYHAIGGFRNGPLWTLRLLAETYPPRLAAGGVREGAVMGVNTRRDVSLVGAPEVVAGAFDDGATIASVATKVVGRDPKLDMFLRVDLELAYAKDGAGRGRGVRALLGELCDHVEHTVFAALEPR